MNEDKRRAFGRRLTKLRKQNGTLAKDLAKKLGKSEETGSSYISQYETGIKHPKESTVEEIAEILDYPVSAFDDGSLDTETAMHRLFRVYETFDGEVKSGKEIKQQIEDGSFNENQYYISVSQLDCFILPWWAKIKEYEAGDISEDDLSEWMDRFRVREDFLDVDIKKLREILNRLQDKKQ